MKLLLVDDDHLICEGLKLILELEESFEVIGTAHNGNDAITFCELHKPDVILMDIRMPVCDGVQATTKIKNHYPDIKIIMLTTFKDHDYINSALNSGADGYILKSQSTDSIIESIKAVSKGSVVLEKDVADLFKESVVNKKKSKKEDYHLTQREYDIITLVGEGYSNKEISSQLFISEGTVRNYLSTILEKLNLRDRTQLAIFYIHHFE